MVKELEKELQKFEAKDRFHMQIENKMQHHNSNMEEKLNNLKEQVEANDNMYQEC